MKKFSTAGVILALAAAIAQPALAAEPGQNAPRARSCAFLTNAPDQHKVVRGDTLWEISGRFLQHPWCWPQVWDLNREQIRNPHWIYPGQIVYFDRAAGRLRLGQGAGAGTGDVPLVRMTPQVRTEGMGREAIPAIPASAIEPFLSQPLIVEENALADTPRIVATNENHVYLGKGDKAYVRGDLKGHTRFQVFRPSRPLFDPISRAVIGHEAAYLGTVRLDRAAAGDHEAHRFVVDSSRQEIGVGDRLLPVPPDPVLNYAPHAPDAPLAAHVVSVYGGVGSAGQNDVISVNRGKASGVDVGTVLELYRTGAIVPDRTDNNVPVKLPDDKYGTLFIFRVFDNISYGLVMQVTDTVRIGDVARSPE
jgi:hypothetical protein